LYVPAFKHPAFVEDHETSKQQLISIYGLFSLIIFVDVNDIKRYECKIAHVNDAREQTWTVSKTVCLLRKGFTVPKVTRQGTDRNTIYMIEGVQ
jgi:hypothetical protein